MGLRISGVSILSVSPKRFCLSLAAAGLVGIFAPSAWAASLYNLTGSEHGFGDVVGPFLLAQQEAKGEKTYLLLDDRAEQVLKVFLERPRGLEASERLRFVREVDLPSLRDVDRVVETFAGARGGNVVEPLPALPDRPRTLLTTHDLHSPYGRPYFPLPFQASGLSEVKGPGAHFYFSAAGLGRERLGILADPSVDLYVNLGTQERRARAAERFIGTPMEELLLRKKHPAALLSFAYGVHNEVFTSPKWKPYPGQFKSYLKGLARIARRERKPVVLLTPNKEELLRQAMGARPAATLEGSDAFFRRSSLKAGRVHVVSTGNLSNSQFVALTAASDLPYMIEGDSALSAAVRLQKPFVMMKGPWGLFGIDGLSRALTEAGAPWAKEMYPIHAEPANDTPSFARLDRVLDDPKAFVTLRENARDWSASLAKIMALAEGEAEPNAVFADLKDPVLRYSWARNQRARGAISEARYLTLVDGLPDLPFLESLLKAKELIPPPARGCPAAYGRLVSP